MTPETLLLHRKDGRLVARIERREGGALVRVFATERVQKDVDRWLRDGLTESASSRVMPNEQAFFERVATYVRRLGMHATIERAATNAVVVDTGTATRALRWVTGGARIAVESGASQDVRA